MVSGIFASSEEINQQKDFIEEVESPNINKWAKTKYNLIM